MTLVLWFKFTGIPNMEKVMNQTTKNLKILINGTMEESLNNKNNRYSKYNFIPSSDWKKGTPKDILQFTVRWKDKFYTGWDEYDQFPFDKLRFSLTFEVVNFNLNDK